MTSLFRSFVALVLVGIASASTPASAANYSIKRASAVVKRDLKRDHGFLVKTMVVKKGTGGDIASWTAIAKNGKAARGIVTLYERPTGPMIRVFQLGDGRLTR